MPRPRLCGGAASWSSLVAPQPQPVPRPPPGVDKTTRPSPRSPAPVGRARLAQPPGPRPLHGRARGGAHGHAGCVIWSSPRILTRTGSNRHRSGDAGPRLLLWPRGAGAPGPLWSWVRSGEGRSPKAGPGPRAAPLLPRRELPRPLPGTRGTAAPWGLRRQRGPGWVTTPGGARTALIRGGTDCLDRNVRTTDTHLCAGAGFPFPSH